ncbi:MAG: Fe-S cluster assembly protein SufD, partial [bacterium]
AESRADLVRGKLGAAVPAAMGRLEALNLARWQAGLVVHVARGAARTQSSVEGPSSPVLIRSRPGPGFNASRLLVVAEPGSDVTILREFAPGGPEGAPAHVNEVIEVFADAGSRVRLLVVQELDRRAVVHLTVRAEVGRDARLDTIVLSLGGGAVKADVGAILAGEGADSESWGVVVGSGGQHHDHHTVHEHRAGRTRSNFDYKTGLSGRARSVYTGVIRIERDAPHCEAYQENRNLMLSETAKADSIPELEILNNEVRCTHGATMGPIEPEHVFYLESRGIPRPEATRLIVEGFVDKTLARIPAALQPDLRARVIRRLEEAQ